MKRKFFILALAAMFSLQGATGVLAADDTAVEKGPMTEEHPVAWGLTSLPLRLTTGAVGAAAGLVGGTFRGIYEVEKNFAEHTWSEVPEKPLLLPAALVGTVLAVPVGVFYGAPKDAAEYGAEGYKWWDRF